MTDQGGLKPYQVEVSVDAGRDEVWESVTQGPVLHQWFGWDYDGLEAEIQQIFLSEATFVAPERMGWADGSFLEVDGDDDKSVVRVAREAPEHRESEEYDPIEEGWRAFLIQLRFLLQERPQGRRRTLYLTGETTGKQALALVDGPWEQSGRRVAWAANDAGHLVVVAARLPLHSHEAAHVEITVSTFGLDDAAFEEQRKVWTKRWAPIAAYARVTTAADPAPGNAGPGNANA
jgi:hypothetical protein